MSKKKEFLKEFNLQEICKALLYELGDDPERAGLKETPRRFAKAMQELFNGMNYTNEQIAEKYDKCFEEGFSNDLVVVDHIPFFSHCEHHIMLMYNMRAHIAYIPNGKVLGLSKFARIVQLVGKRLQIQERICKDIAEVLKLILQTEDIAVIVEGDHSCMTARGVRSDGSRTKTSHLGGKFKDNAVLRQEMLEIIKLKNR